MPQRQIPSRISVRLFGLLGLWAGLAWVALPAWAADGRAPAAVSAAEPTGVPEAPRAARNRWGEDYFPNLPLVNQDGVVFRLYDDLLKGKTVAVNLMYTGCTDVCPLETANLARVQRILGDRVGRDIHFYSISIDPLNDTPQALKAFKKKFDIGPGWEFFTGKPEDIRVIARKLGLVRESDKENPDGHTSGLMVGNVPGGMWLRNSAVDNPQFLVAKIGTFLGKWNDLMPLQSYAGVTRNLELKPGQALFQSACSACHTVGEGRKIGPDLGGVTARRDRAWLARYIQTPTKVQAEGDPIAASLAKQFPDVRMPTLNLASGDVAALMAYLESPMPSTDKTPSKVSLSAR